MARKSLTAGFTGDIEENQRVSTKAKSAIAKAKDEAGMVAAHAADHPTATGSAMLAVGMLCLAVGYVLGASSASRHRHWG
jgi:hypothetical protein